MQVQTKARARGRVGALVLLTGSLALAAFLAIALRDQRAVAGRRIDLTEAQRMAATVRAGSGFLVPVDEIVLAKLNDLVRTRRGWTTEAMDRLQDHRAQVEARLEAAGLPRELAALPLTESGFDNTARPTAVPEAVRAAGIWQLTPEIARSHGLEVTPTRDDRLDIIRATDAAAAYLADLHEKSGSWPAAIAAYRTDPEPGYVETVYAAVLLMRHPELVR